MPPKFRQGELVGKYFDEVWRSADGKNPANWVSVTVSGSRFPARRDHDAVSYGGSVWVIGGFDGEQRLNDVWRSADGTDWVLVTASAAFSRRGEHRVVSHGGSLWVIGGREMRLTAELNDVWRSADGEEWVLVTASAAFAARADHQAFSFGGNLWVVGGGLRQ